MTSKNLKTVCSIEDLPLSLTVKEAAQVLRIGNNAAYGLVRCGSLRCIKIGRCLRIPRQALVEFISQSA